MPSRAPALDPAMLSQLAALGERIRARRKALKLTATAAAAAAGLSRVTLHRVERGEPAVTLGAYLNVLAVVGLQFGLSETPRREPSPPTIKALMRQQRLRG